MSQSAPRSPYCGLVPYQEEDAAFFFGRTGDIGLVIANLLASRLTLFYGASGVGKSSVLNAGVVPELRRLAANNREQVGKPELAVVVLREWAHAPALRLTRSVRDACALAVGVESPQAPYREGDLLSALREGSAQVGGDVLVILDQFEEHFLYGATEDDAESFDDALVSALNDTKLHANFLISIREDGLAKLDQFKGRIPKLFDNYLRIQHLDAAAAKDAIEKPVERFNTLFRAGQLPITLGEGLVEAVLSEVRTGQVTISDAAVGGVGGGSAGETRIETPFLQLVLERLWDTELGQGSTELRRSTFTDTLGGALNVVQTHVRSALQALTADEKRLAAAAFRYLITPSRTKIALTAADLAAMGELPPEALADLLEKLTRSDYRILKPVPPPPDRADAVSYEIGHDVLAQAILDWRAEQVRLAEVEAVRERTDAELQSARHRADEQEAAATRSRKWTILVSIFLMLSLVLGVYGKHQHRVAQDKAAEAEKQASVATTRKLIADARLALATDPELGLLLARHATRETINAGPDLATEARDALDLALSASRVRLTSAAATGPNDYELARVDVAKDDRIAIAAFGPGGPIVKFETDDKSAPYTSLPRPVAKVVDMALSPDGKQVALALENGSLEIREIATGTTRTISLGGEPLAITWLRDNLTIASATKDGRVTLRNTTSGTTREFPAFTPKDGQWMFALDFSPNGQWLAGAGSDREIRVWSVADLQKVYRFCGHKDDLTAVRFAPDGLSIASSSNDSTVWLWALDGKRDTRDCVGTPLRKFVGHVNTVFDLRFSADGKTLATASADTTVRLWDVATGKTLLTLLGHRSPVERIAFLSGDEQIASSSWDGTVRVWDVTGYSDVYEGGDTPEGKLRFVTLNKDGYAAVRDTTGGELFRQARFADATSIGLDRAGERVAVGHANGHIETKTFATGNAVNWPAHDGTVTALAVSSDGEWVASGGDDGLAILWNAKTGKQKDKADHKYRVNTVDFSPDGRFLLTVDVNGGGRLWRIGQSNAVLAEGHTGDVSSVAWSRDGRWLATASQDHTVRLRSLPDGKLVRTLDHATMVFGVAFSPDSQRILTVAGTVARQFRVPSGEEIQPRIEGHENLITVGRYSPDGTRIVTAGWDRTTRLWDSGSGAQLAKYTHDYPLRDAAFSPDGRALTTVGETAQVRYILLDVAQLLSLADERITRKFTDVECQRYLRLEHCPVE
jgi:WD40 repeat protein